MPRDNKTSPQKRPVRRSAAAAKGKDDGAKVDSASRKRKGAADDDAPRLTRNKRSRAAADVGEWSAEDVSAYLGSLAVAPAAVEKIAAKAVDGPKLRALSAGALSWLPRDDRAAVLGAVAHLDDPLLPEFLRHDGDGSFTLDAAELALAVPRVGGHYISKKTAQKMLDEADADGSGALSFAEFRGAVDNKAASAQWRAAASKLVDDAARRGESAAGKRAPSGAAAKRPSKLALGLADVLRVWLTGFLGVVGVMKGAGKLPHTLSVVAGPVEAAGALLQLPLIWRRLREATRRRGAARAKAPGAAATLSVVGGWCFLAALGLIVSTYKRRSPVCWSQAVLSELYLLLAFPRYPGKKGRPGGARAALVGLVSFAAGVAAGRELQQRFPGL